MDVDAIVVSTDDHRVRLASVVAVVVMVVMAVGFTAVDIDTIIIPNNSYGVALSLIVLVVVVVMAVGFAAMDVDTIVVPRDQNRIVLSLIVLVMVVVIMRLAGVKLLVITDKNNTTGRGLVDVITNRDRVARARVHHVGI